MRKAPPRAKHGRPRRLARAVIPVVDVRTGGPVEHARIGRDRMIALREGCVPGPLRALAPLLDRLSSDWLARTPSPYVREVAAIADIAAVPGVWFVNASYEWGCTTRVDAAPSPLLRRTLDWPFAGLGRHVEVALQAGGAGIYANVTWPGAVGVLTAVAPGRFAAAINQAPLFRRTRGRSLVPIDLVRNAIETFRTNGRWPAAHLLRHVFDTAQTFDEAYELLSIALVAKPVLFSLIGTEPSQACLIERTETEAVVHRGDFTIANDWHPGGPPRSGYWMARGTFLRGPNDSERRRQCLEAHDSACAFDWVRAPVRNALTRLAVEVSAAGGEMRLVGYEPTGGLLSDIKQATEVLELKVEPDPVVKTDGSGPHVPPARWYSPTSMSK